MSELGLSVPAQRRLRDAVKKEKKKDKKFKKKYGKGLPNLNISEKTYENIDQRGALIEETSIEVGEELGDGSFGVVRAGIWSNGNLKIPVAIKSLKVRGSTPTRIYFKFYTIYIHVPIIYTEHCLEKHPSRRTKKPSSDKRPW